MAKAWIETCSLGFNSTLQMLAGSFYRSIYPKCKVIRLTKGDKPHILDKEFHIDVILEQANGMKITLQEKFRKAKDLKYHDFTLEYESNRWTHVKGEWFLLCSDLYAYGWATPNKDAFLRFYIFKVFPFKQALIKRQIKPKHLQKNERYGDANFYPFSFDDFPDEWFLLKYKRR